MAEFWVVLRRTRCWSSWSFQLGVLYDSVILWLYFMQILHPIHTNGACLNHWDSASENIKASCFFQGQICGSRFLEEFPVSEEVLVEGILVLLFWTPAGWEGCFFFITGVLFLLLNILLGSSLFTKESASSERRVVLIVMGLYMLNHCWKTGWWRRSKLNIKL